MERIGLKGGISINGNNSGGVVEMEESNKVVDLSHSKRKALEFIYSPLPPFPVVIKVEEPPPTQEILTVTIEPTSDTAPKPSNTETYIFEKSRIVKEIAPKPKEKSPELFKVRDALAILKNIILWRKKFNIDALIDEDLGEDLEKEESNKVADLSNSKRKALEFIYSPLPPFLVVIKVEEPPPTQEILVVTIEPTSDTAPKPSNTETYILEKSRIVKEIAPKPKEKSPKSEVVEKEIAEIAKIEITNSPPKEISIWGVPLLKDNRTDVILLKFLQAIDFKVRGALAILKNIILWRKEFNIDALIDEDLSEDLEKVVFMHCFDKE
ncbi:patellin-1-like [Camellia sinensis]|uniref:patellin-1-like n=1 Tax=Camellia sinensis TaxID=4442 RepID=UPI001036CBCD|nr:patellin-1-like [Camellia sinensis]